MTTKPTIRDVALHAGVSTATVSHVLNGTRFVREDTRKRVLQSIQALNYNPNIAARVLKTGKKKIIGFVVPNIRDEFFSTIIDECEQELSEQDFRLLIMSTHEKPQREKACLNYLSGGAVDGILLASTIKNYKEIEEVLHGNLPVVCLDRSPMGCTCDIVRVNTDDALEQGLLKLIARGCEKIAFFEVHAYISTIAERRTIYQSVMKAHGLESHLISLSDITNTIIDPYMNDIIQQGFDAVVIPNNYTTISVLNYMLVNGLTVGKDIQMIAFQDTVRPYVLLHNAYLVKQPTQRMGREAARLMLKRLAEPDMPVTIKELSASAEYRE